MTKGRRAWGLGVALALVLGGCGSAPDDVDLATLTVRPIRGGVQVGDTPAGPIARVGAGDPVVTAEGAQARVELDGGGRLLVDGGARLSSPVEGELALEAGRVFAEAPAGVTLRVTVGTAELRLSDGSISIARDAGATRVYVVAGEVAYRQGDARGTARAGELLTLAEGSAPTTVPETLWADWTGGLARASIHEPGLVPGMGVLEARVPDEVGVARWPLAIRRLDVRVSIVGDLAVTEVEQEFFNPASETVEGLYRARVPEGAVLQRFAVDRNGALVDGYVREEAQARAAYEAQVYRGSTDDPALLAWDAPGAYRARIYPIAPGEVRRVLIRYAEWIGPAREGGPRLYRYPMGGGASAPFVEELSFVADLGHAGASRVRAGLGARVEGQAVVLRQSDVRPRSDLWLELEDEAPASPRAYRAAHTPPARAPGSRAVVHEADERDYWYLPLRLPGALTASVAREGLDLVVVADLSAGTGRAELELGRAIVESLASHLGPNDRLAIVGADLGIRALGEDGAPALGAVSAPRLDAILDALSRAPAGGATDLGAVLAQAAGLLDPARPGAVVYVGDAAPTVGQLEAQALVEHLGRLPHPMRLYGVGVGADARIELLDALCRGGGLALRVESPAEAGDAALRVLSHAARPRLSRVTVDVGRGVDNVFPRRPVDVVEGETLAIVGRVRDDVPTAVTVRGEVLGQPFEQRIEVRTEESEDAVDLRLRWAGERLAELLLEGASREEIAELGTRAGLITPTTSYYVPSARELGAMGPSASRFRVRRLDDADAVLARHAAEAPSSRLLGLALGPLALTGCSLSRDASPASSEPALEPPPGEPQGAAMGAPMEADQLAHAEGTASRAVGDAPSPSPAAPSAIAEALGALEEAPIAAAAPAPPPPAQAQTTPAEPIPDEAAARGPTGGGIALGGDIDGLGLAANGVGGGGAGEGTIGLGSIGAIGHGAGTGTGSGYGRGGGGFAGPARRRPAPTDARDATREQTERANRQEARGGGRWTETVSVTTRVTTTVTSQLVVPHARVVCSDASRLGLEDRRALWRERLARTGWIGAMVDVVRDAQRACETPDARARRALLRLVLEQAGSLSAMIDLHRMFDEAATRAFLRGEIQKRVRTADDLRLVRRAFGLSSAVDWALVEQVLARATSPDARLRALRDLVAQQPDSFELRLRLREELEVQGRLPEVLRLAEALRADPLADAGVRTALGEMYLRLGRVDDARRAFSEIVEFAPLDELARRRLGDLYRAHGWFDDAYRQYETLASIRPDDASILLLLAQAAAGAGRTDEALRLEQRAMETAAPGAREGLARIAQLWSSVRFAALKSEARQQHDEAALEALAARLRRSGVLRDAGDLRVSLTWAHPDAQVSLWAAHPGLSLSRPDDLAPELGLEAFDVAEQEGGVYRLEVRRDTRDRLGEVDATLTLVWHEGRDDERVEIVPVHLDASHPARAWTLEGATLAAAEPSPQAARAASTGGR